MQMNFVVQPWEAERIGPTQKLLACGAMSHTPVLRSRAPPVTLPHRKATATATATATMQMQTQLWVGGRNGEGSTESDSDGDDVTPSRTRAERILAQQQYSQSCRPHFPCCRRWLKGNH